MEPGKMLTFSDLDRNQDAALGCKIIGVDSPPSNRQGLGFEVVGDEV